MECFPPMPISGAPTGMIIELMNIFEDVDEQTCDTRRGYYGFVGQQSVIKSCDTVKDVWVGEGTYIKGANKLKNLRLRSTLAETIQVGEGR